MSSVQDGDLWKSPADCRRYSNKPVGPKNEETWSKDDAKQARAHAEALTSQNWQERLVEFPAMRLTSKTVFSFNFVSFFFPYWSKVNFFSLV